MKPKIKWASKIKAWLEVDSKVEEQSALAYLLGAYLSDGSLSINEDLTAAKAHWGGIKDEYFIDCIGIALTKIGVPYSFGDRAKFQGTYRRRFRIRERKNKKELGNWLWEVSGEKKEILPKIPRELVRPLVAGLMDGDGGAYLSPRGGVTLHYTGKAGFVQDFRTLLTSLGIRISSQGTKNHQFCINREDFLREGLCFAMPRKQALLVLWCKKVIKSNRCSRKVAIAKWYLREANHLGGNFAMYTTAIPTGTKRFPE